MIAQVRIRESRAVIGTDGAWTRELELCPGATCVCAPVVHLRFAPGAQRRPNVVQPKGTPDA